MPSGDDVSRQPLDEASSAIEAEAERLRRSEHDLLQRLDDAYERLVPRTSSWRDALDANLAALDRLGQIDAEVPLASRWPGGALVKRLIRRSVEWYVRFLIDQVGRFAEAVTRALHLLARREEVGDGSPVVLPPLPEQAGRSWWSEVVAGALARAPGPVVGSGPREAVPGELVATLDELADRLVRRSPGTVGAVVLAGPVQWSAPVSCRRVVEQAAAALAPGGVFVVASSTPEAWARRAPRVYLDLAPGRPLHPESWVHLLATAGFEGLEVVRGGEEAAAGEPAEYLVRAVRR